MSDAVGLTVSEFYKYSIEFNYYHFGKPLRLTEEEELKDNKLKDFLSKGQWGSYFDSTDVLNIRRDNIPHMAQIITKKIIEINEELWKDLREVIMRDGVKYTPTCAITFTDVESLTPLVENTSISKLVKAFRTRVKISNALDENYYVNFGKLQAMVESAIKEQLLYVVDQIKEEETYTPKVDLSGILPPMMKQV